MSSTGRFIIAVFEFVVLSYDVDDLVQYLN